MFYFAYGSNLWLEQMLQRCPDAKDFGKGVLKDYRWIISARGYANVVRSVNDTVYGVIYEISESDEKRLDRYEGVAGGSYKKKFMMIYADEKKLECLVYIDPVEEEGEAQNEYIVRINKGLCDANLPKEYITRYIRIYIPEI